VLARLGKCLYCGGALAAPVPAQAAPTAAAGAGTGAPGPALPPALLFALEPREVKANGRRLWMLRIGAVAVVALALLVMVAMSVGRPE